MNNDGFDGRRSAQAAPAPPDLVMRRGSHDDVDVLTRLSTGPISGKRAFIAQSIAARETVTAWVDERIVGYVVWDRAFFGRPFVWLLGVDPLYRRRGIAGRLLREFARNCRSEPLFTSTNESNHATQALLAVCGFVYSGRVENLDPGDPELFYFRAAAA